VTGAELVDRGLDGLEALRSPRGFDASDAESGLYPALYGRDSLWVLLLLLEALALRPDDRVDALVRASGPLVLSSLAEHQGAAVDDRVEEQPGRIPHEYHPVASAHARDMGLPLADGRSYGGFDETFLFVLAYDAVVRAGRDGGTAERLWPHVARALAWIDEWADADGDGLFEYARRHPANLLNEVWKDSFDAVTHTGFDVPPGPLAWLEVQAYASAAFRAAARAFDDRGDAEAADRYRRRAEAVAAQVDERFWLGPDEGFAMALDGRKEPVRMIASNPGHALWAGVVRDGRVDPLVARMLRPDLMSAHGLRTLSSESAFYAPFAYHRGAVWPFDNAIFALGLLRHGKVAAAVRVAATVGAALTTAGTPVECYVVLEPERVVDPPVGGPLLCWHRWPVRNRVQAMTAAALVVFGAVLEVHG
jgi:glycogen debranching enzyme